MTLTDREIAILHLALTACHEVEGYCAQVFAALLRDAEGEFDDDAAHCDSEVAKAIRMVPLYRHAFGIEAPGEAAGEDAHPVPEPMFFSDEEAIRCFGSMADATEKFRKMVDEGCGWTRDNERGGWVSGPHRGHASGIEAPAPYPQQSPRMRRFNDALDALLERKRIEAREWGRQLLAEQAAADAAETENGCIPGWRARKTDDGTAVECFDAAGQRIKGFTVAEPYDVVARDLVRAHQAAFEGRVREVFEKGEVRYIRTVDQSGDIAWDYERKPSPASLAIANALSRTRP